LFHLATGDVPFEGNVNELSHQHKYEPIPSISELRPGVPESLVQIIEKCMEKEKKDRFQKAEEALKALNDIETRVKNKKKNSKQTDKVKQDEMKKIKKRQTSIKPNKNEIILTEDKTVYNLAGNTSKIEKPANNNSKNSNQKTKRLKK
jgi:serine/threonine-protein kinase